MHWFPQIYIFLNLLGAIICVALGITVPKKREDTDISFQIFIFTIGIWCLISALFFFNYSIDDFWIWQGLLVFPYAFVPVFWLIFVSRFADFNLRGLKYLFIVPFITFLIYWFKPLSFLMWRIENYRIQWGVPMVDFQRGYWFRFIHTPYSYALVLVGFGLLVRGYVKAHQSFRELYLILLVVGFVPLFTNGLTLTPLFPYTNFFDLTPIAYTVISVIFCLAISHYRLLHRSPLAYKEIFSSLQNSILVFDNYHQLVEANPAANMLLDLPVKRTHLSFEQILPFIQDTEMDELDHRGITEIFYQKQYLEVSKHSIQNTKQILGYLVTIKDVTQARQLEVQLLEGALLYDALTNLPNRTLFQDRLDQASKFFKRHPQVPFAVLFLDLDRFKVINDSFGHSTGDQLLIEVSKRLSTCLREHDTVARLSGDEFAILAEDITREEVAILCKRIQSLVQEPFDYQGRTLQVSVSIGIAFSDSTLSPEQMLRNADLAMYQTKANGKAGFTTYDHLLHKQLVSTMQLEIDFRKALSEEEFFVEYQPIVCLETGDIKGFESLVRWAHPQKGRIAPIQFIDLAEEIGLIGKLDLWIFEQACLQLSRWNFQFPNHGLTLSINLSVANFSNPDLGTTIAKTLEAYKIMGSQIKFEITESLLMENPSSIGATLETIKTLGIGIQLDDFGTGHSSLSYLHQLPLDALKIDRSFVMNAYENPQSQAIIKSIVDLALNLKLLVIGEGVETKQQCQLLKDLGCTYGQGFFWRAALSSQDATRLLKQQIEGGSLDLLANAIAD